MSTSRGSAEISYKDSGKVLRAIEEELATYRESLTPLAEEGRDSSVSGGIAMDTLRRIEEVIDNAPTTTLIPNKSSRSS